MTCVTCHDIRPGHESRRNSRDAMVRDNGAGTGMLCMSCHVNATGRALASHGSSLIRAHLTTRPGGTSIRGGLDAESQACVACHDGTGAGDSGVHGTMRGDSDVSSEHPIGVRYQSKRQSDQSEEVRVVAAAMLDRRIRLFDQSVGCGSCHNVYSGREKLLVMSNLGSRLCLSCHVQ